MTDLMELYQELILDHNRRPRNLGSLEGADHQAEGYNPLCGDRVRVNIRMKGGLIEDVRFEGSGCAISTASASIMSETIKGKTTEEAQRIFEQFRGLVTNEPGAPDAAPLGKLEAFAGVGRFPARVKCATLAWHTLIAALADRADTVTTE